MSHLKPIDKPQQEPDPRTWLRKGEMPFLDRLAYYRMLKNDAGFDVVESSARRLGHSESRRTMILLALAVADNGDFTHEISHTHFVRQESSIALSNRLTHVRFRPIVSLLTKSINQSLERLKTSPSDKKLRQACEYNIFYSARALVGTVDPDAQLALARSLQLVTMPMARIWALESLQKAGIDQFFTYLAPILQSENIHTREVVAQFVVGASGRYAQDQLALALLTTIDMRSHADHPIDVASCNRVLFWLTEALLTNPLQPSVRADFIRCRDAVSIPARHYVDWILEHNPAADPRNSAHLATKCDPDSGMAQFAAIARRVRQMSPEDRANVFPDTGES